MKRKACCHVANAFLSRLKLVWSIFSPKCPKKKYVLGKKLLACENSRPSSLPTRMAAKKDGCFRRLNTCWSQWVNIDEPIPDYAWNSPGIVHIWTSFRYLFLQHQLKLQSTADIHDISTAGVLSPNLTRQV